MSGGSRVASSGWLASSTESCGGSSTGAPERLTTQAKPGSQHNHEWGGHTTEFFAIGTAVRPIRDDHTVPPIYLTLGLDT